MSTTVTNTVDIKADPDDVYAKTAGNPFFVVELSRWMVGAHDLHPDRAPVPPSVGEVLRTRLERLPAGCAEVFIHANLNAARKTILAAGSYP